MTYKLNDYRIKTLLKIFGVIISLRACMVLIIMVASFWAPDNSLKQLYSESPSIAFLKLLMITILACALFAGYGLFFQKKWSRRLAVEVIGVDFFIRLGGYYFVFWVWLITDPKLERSIRIVLEKATSGAELFYSGKIVYFDYFHIEPILMVCIVIFLMTKPVRQYYKLRWPKMQAKDLKNPAAREAGPSSDV